jgi:hypothetical protein
LPELTYLTRTNPDNPAIWETYNPFTGEIVNTGTFAGGGDRGLLAAAAPVIGLAASTIGLPGITGLLGGLTGATGSTLAGLTGATISGGTSAIAGGSTQDIINAALLGGAGAYGGSALNNYLSTGSIADPGITERQFAIADATQLASQGLSTTQIADTLTAGGYNEAIVDRAIASITTPTTPIASTPTAVSVPTATTPDNLVVTGSTTQPPSNTGGVLSNLASTQTTLPTVSITGNTGLMSGDNTNTALVNALSGVSTAVSPVTAQTTTTPTSQTDDKTTSTIPTVTVTTPSLAPPVILPPVIPTVTPPPVVTTPTVPTVPTVTVTAPKEPPPVILPPVIPTVTPTPITPTTPPTTPDKKTNELGLTDEQIINILKASLGLFGTSSLINKGTPTPVVGALPTQTPPMYTDDYFTKVQQNYNRLLPAVPRDVASPLRDWYTSQYGA